MDQSEDYQQAPRRIAQARERRLTTLDLGGLIWDRIPPEVFELDWLESLNIGGSFREWGQLTELPHEFSRLQVLRRLDIARHRIIDLGPLATLPQLQHLDCSGNQLTDLGPIKPNTVQWAHEWPEL